MKVSDTADLSQTARAAIGRRDWQTLSRAATALLDKEPNAPETLFLAGVLERVKKNHEAARNYFERGLQLAPERHDIAVELASQLSILSHHRAAFNVLEPVLGKLKDSPFYSDLAATTLIELGLPELALPLAQRASSLQPNVDIFSANLASCYGYVGQPERAADIYEALLAARPDNRRNHYFLSRLRRATDDKHLQQMNAVLRSDPAPDERNIFLFFAQGKELEDLGLWDDAFAAYQRGGAAVKKMIPKGLSMELDKLRAAASVPAGGLETLSDHPVRGRPIFVVGLPRTGSTLTERILSSHSGVVSLGETRYFEQAIKATFGSIYGAIEQMPSCSRDKLDSVASYFRREASYRLGDGRFFIDKLPLNFIFVPLIARAFPDALFVYTHRQPEAACFSMFKQLFTGEYLFSYDLADLGTYYCEHEHFRAQFASELAKRWVEVSYEKLVSMPEREIPLLLKKLGLSMEDACLTPQINRGASMTASAIQVRQPIHQAGIAGWRHFEPHLGPLLSTLQKNGFSTQVPSVELSND